MKEQSVFIDFMLPFSCHQVFDFIILPENMPLYRGFFMVPGIKSVHTSDAIRKEGTIDLMLNTDGSSHRSTTCILIRGKEYVLSIDEISSVGYKKKLANPLLGLVEQWLLQDDMGKARIKRTLTIKYQDGIFNDLLVKYFIRPQLYFSLLLHHLTLKKALGA